MGGLPIFLHLHLKLNAILAYVWRTELPIKHKREKTNKKEVQKNPPHHENIIRPAMPQLNTVQCPKITNPPKQSSPPPMNTPWEVLTWLIVRIFQKMTKPLKVGNFNYKILLQHTLFLYHPSPMRKPLCLLSKGIKFNQSHPLGRKSSDQDTHFKFKIFEEKERCLW